MDVIMGLILLNRTKNTLTLSELPHPVEYS